MRAEVNAWGRDSDGGRAFLVTEFEQVNTDGVSFYTTKGRSKGQLSCKLSSAVCACVEEGSGGSEWRGMMVARRCDTWSPSFTELEVGSTRKRREDEGRTWWYKCVYKSLDELVGKRGGVDWSFSSPSGMLCPRPLPPMTFTNGLA